MQLLHTHNNRCKIILQNKKSDTIPDTASLTNSKL